MVERVRVEVSLVAEVVAIEWFPGLCVLVRVVVDGAMSVKDVVDVNLEVVEVSMGTI